MVDVHVGRCALSHVLRAPWPRSPCIVCYVASSRQLLKHRSGARGGHRALPERCRRRHRDRQGQPQGEPQSNLEPLPPWSLAAPILTAFCLTRRALLLAGKRLQRATTSTSWRPTGRSNSPVPPRCGLQPLPLISAHPCLAACVHSLILPISQALSGRKGSAYSPCTTPAPTSSRRSLFGQVGPADSNPGHYSLLAAQHSPRTTHQLTTLHSPLTTRHAPLPRAQPQSCKRAPALCPPPAVLRMCRLQPSNFSFPTLPSPTDLVAHPPPSPPHMPPCTCYAPHLLRLEPRGGRVSLSPVTPQSNPRAQRFKPT